MKCPDCGGQMRLKVARIEHEISGARFATLGRANVCEECGEKWIPASEIESHGVAIALVLTEIERDRGLYRRNGKTAISSAVLDGVPEEPVSGELRPKKRQIDALTARGRKPRIL